MRAVKRFDLDAMCRDALARVQTGIEHRYRLASYAVLQEFRAARSRCGQGFTVLRDEMSTSLPAHFRCPECGAGIHAEVMEWTTDDGKPTEGGVRIACAADAEEVAAAFVAGRFDELPTWSHFYQASEWDRVNYLASEWVRENVRVAR